MIRVLLVDDEYLALEDLKTIIDWESAGFVITGTVTSGRQALRFLSKNRVDLVITDISMPDMDGITLIERIKETYSDIFFLLLTAYEEVPYMKRAFALGVEDYLSKDEITEKFLHKKLTSIRKKMEIEHSLKKSYLLEKLQLFFSPSEETAYEELKNYFPGTYGYCVILPPFFPPSPRQTEKYPDNPLTLRLPHLMQLCETFLPGLDPRLSGFFSFFSYHQEIIVLIRIQSMVSEYELSQLMFHFAKILFKHISSAVEYPLSVIYSPYAMTLPALRQDYFAHASSFRARFFYPDNKVMKTTSSRLYLHNHLLSLNNFRIQNWYEENPELLSVHLDKIYCQIAEEHNYTGFTELIDLCIQFLENNAVENFHDNIMQPVSHLEILYRKTMNCIEKLVESKSVMYSRDTQKALSYIHHHYSEMHLSIQDISDYVGLSPAHLSRLFKNDIHMTIWDYLTKYRITKACSILKETDIKIYEIAEMTGYSSAQYFSQVFYKYMAVKPLDYRKQHNNKITGESL